MTKASEVTVTREEVRAFVEAAGLVRVRGDVQAALAAFLAARVPDAVAFDPSDEHTHQGWKDKFHGANKFRDAVLRGPGE